MAKAIDQAWVLENGGPLNAKGVKRGSRTGVSSPKFDERTWSPVNEGRAAVPTELNCYAEMEMQQQNDECEVSLIQPKTFARHSTGSAKTTRVVCCDRCKSDLNGKLLARCSACGFSRHLYCFSPPLKHHPALESQPVLKKRISASAAQVLIAQWQCQSCMVGVAGESRQLGSPKRVNNVHSKSTKKRALPKGDSCSANLQMPQPEVALSPPKLAPQKLTNEFDWYKFRADKAARVLDPAGNKDELVYYSRSVALMRKTARFWFYYVHQKKMRSHMTKRQQEWMSGPKILDVKYTLKENDQIKAETSRQRRMTEEIIIQKLFTDDQVCSQYYRPLRQSQASIFNECLDTTTTINQFVADTLSEMAEAVSMSDEDVDALFISDSPDLSESGQGILGLQLAARIIHRFVRSKLRKRRIQDSNVQTAQPTEMNDDKSPRIDAHTDLGFDYKRRERTRSLLSIWILSGRFLARLLTNLKQLQMKKALVVMLTESVPFPTEPCEDDEDEEVKDLSEETIQLERERVSRSRIANFFIKYVRPRVHRRKIAMTARIKRWWKREVIRQKWLTWTKLATVYMLGVRNTACRRIQRTYRRYRVKVEMQATLEKLAIRRLRLFLRQWMMNRLVKKERERMELYGLATYLSFTPPSLLKQPDAPTPLILRELGMAAYSAGDFWSAAYLFEKFIKVNGSLDVEDMELMVPFAYAHHMAWYTSYDSFNLTRAHELYCIALESVSKLEGSSSIDPEVLQDLAVVMMQMGNASSSLRLLAKLIEHFPQEPSFTTWLLLAAVQMSHRGEWEQSVQYLTYIQDIPPAPYLERDMLVLCAIGYQHCARQSGDLSRKEAWRAALRLWSAEKKSNTSNAGNRTSQGHSQPAEERLKWEVTTDLATRALSQGHYLLACQMFAYALGRFQGADLYARQAAWWSLGDAYRHLGKLDAYLEAATRSQAPDEEKQADESIVMTWKEHAVRSARSFQDDLDNTSTRDKLQQLGAGITG